VLCKPPEAQEPCKPLPGIAKRSLQNLLKETLQTTTTP
jgi:hypothetical protein